MITSNKILNPATAQFHFYARCTHPSWFHYPLPELWVQFSKIFPELSRKYQSKLKAFVMLPNHFHGVIEMNFHTRNEWAQDLEEHVEKFFPGLRVLEEKVHLILIQNKVMYKETLLYVYRNPIHHGLTQSLMRYPFSTLNELFGHSTHAQFFVQDDMGLIYHPGQIMKKGF